MTTPSYVQPRAYPIREVAISLFSKIPEHIQEGDVVAVRPAQVGIGMKEAGLWLWLLIDGLEESQYTPLTDPVYEPFDPTGIYKPRSAYPVFDKRRFCIPLARIKQLIPTFDLDRARDPNDPYQPFYAMDEDNNLWLTDQTPWQAEGLIFDKETGAYI